ncbi:MAG: hypothetical protein LBJ89_00140 [Holosporales bacterium]|jgi:hypothetical protein|nr:hypothetical protein [Holosporales bacterium]
MRFLVLEMACLSSFVVCAVANDNPNHNTAYHMGRVSADVALALVPQSKMAAVATGVASDYSGAGNAVGKICASTSDQAWDMMKFYEDHGLDEESMDQGLQIRQAGCEVY